MTDVSVNSETALEHAWRYFELHANQRMSVFNFFLVLAGLVSAGLAAAIQGSPRLAVLGIVLGILLALVSFVFWKLDQRVSFLIKHAEAALAELEALIPNQQGRLFLNERTATSAACSRGSWWARYWTCGRSFRAVFWVMGTFGIAGSILSACRLAGFVRR